MRWNCPSESTLDEHGGRASPGNVREHRAGFAGIRSTGSRQIDRTFGVDRWVPAFGSYRTGV
jgi:hypothetical protein